MTLKTFFKNLKTKVKSLFSRLNDDIKKYVPVAVSASEKLKEAVNNGTYDTVSSLISAIIPTDYDKLLLAALKSYLEKNLVKMITGLQLVDIAANYDTIDEAYSAVLSLIKNAGESAQDAVWTEFAQAFLDALTDGELTKSERQDLVKLWYDNIEKES